MKQEKRAGRLLTYLQMLMTVQGMKRSLERRSRTVSTGDSSQRKPHGPHTMAVRSKQSVNSGVWESHVLVVFYSAFTHGSDADLKRRMIERENIRPHLLGYVTRFCELTFTFKNWKNVYPEFLDD